MELRRCDGCGETATPECSLWWATIKVYDWTFHVCSTECLRDLGWTLQPKVKDGPDPMGKRAWNIDRYRNMLQARKEGV